MTNRFLFAFFSAAAAFAQPGGGGPGGGGPGGGGPGGPGAGTQGDGIWVRNAYFGERQTFDACLGHQPQNGQYHHHAHPVCLRAQLNDNLTVVATGRTGTTYAEKTSGWKHSPILGWAYDGYPIYGPYGYSDPKSASSAIKRIKSSFQLRSITTRTTLPNWLLSYHSVTSPQLATNQYGPTINTFYPLGRYIEDFDYLVGLGDLDQYNGRFTVTPEYPSGTYAYFVTINDDGSPAFPYIVGMQYYGNSVNGAGNANVPSTASDYFVNGTLAGPASTDPLIASFPTKNSQQNAQVVVGWDPSAGATTTWPGTQPSGAATANGGASTPVKADVQRIRTDPSNVYVNSNNLPSYTIGPWFAEGNGGVFNNFPSQLSFVSQITRLPQAAAGTHTSTGLGAVGVWVNGVAVFNVLDGGSYSNAQSADVGGGGVAATSLHLSAASLEGGPVTPGALVSAFAYFGSTLATSTQTASSTTWPTTLGGATVTVRDVNGTTAQAQISYASPSQINYRVPTGLASGVATVTIAANGTNVPGALDIVTTYPGIFKSTADGLAAAQVARLQNGQAVYQYVAATGSDGSTQPAPISVTGGDSPTLVLYGTGLNGASGVTATINGGSTPVSYAGPQGTWAGLDQINIPLPSSLAGKGKSTIIVTAAGKPSNPVYVVIQ